MFFDFQNINELYMEGYNHGGINMTGLRIVDFANDTVKKFIKEDWLMLDNNTWAGGGRNKIAVRLFTRCFEGRI